MMIQIQNQIEEMFNRIEIFPEYSEDTIKISRFSWNNDVVDFLVEYYIEHRKFVFHYSDLLARDLDIEPVDPLKQLECEVKYIKRMVERGIGAKEFYPFTRIED
ncbi:hypothetical protein ACFYKX_07580 [Cytobacillus sp. FJAT-54145]|uniref:Uncharacterized protein n=1 Tax=Cytobacillus spartinae TaxID=3299023 RepID=A0ABW6K8D4_9BACI